jgi:TolA-binding protein
MGRKLVRGLVTLGVASLLSLATPPGAWGVSESDRLWLVAERAFADRLYSISRRSLERFLRVYPDDLRVPEGILLLGKSQLALGDLPHALENFRKAQRFTPPPGRPEEARFWEAEILLRQRRFAEARSLWDTLLATNAAAPFAPDAMYGVGRAELGLKRPAAAAAAFQQLLEAWPDSPLAPSATVYLARTFMELKRAGEVGALLEPFLSRHPAHPLAPDAQYLLGMSRLATGRTTEGLRDLREFVAAHPRYELAAAARRAITDTLRRVGTRAGLAQEYESLVSQSPPTAEGLYDAGLIARELGRPSDAEAAWRRLRAAFPGHPLIARASLALAQEAFKRNEFREAAVLAQAASRIDDGGMRAEALLLIGESELKQKHHQPALKAFQAAAAAIGVDAVLRFRGLAGIGLVREGLHQWKEAARIYEEVAAESPDRALKQWARERLSAVRAKTKPGAKTAGDNRGS